LCFILLQVSAGEESEEGRIPLQISPVACLFAAVREPTRRQWRPRVEKMRSHCSSVQKPFITVLAVAKGFPCDSQIVLGLFCKFQIV
jgi:hypothetical protein